MSSGAPRRHRRLPSIPPDPIDALDTSSPAGAYHHPGPYDATLISRNLNPKYSPVAAVRDSNMKALRATPREYVVDSLTKHVPLQGTSTIPPGEKDFRGDRMNYEEGADLMREEGSWGGGYGRWDALTYHPDDLKGKGEPSYSIEEAEKARRRRKLQATSTGTDSSYELEPYSDRSPPEYSDSHSLRPGTDGRKRSVSDVGQPTGNSLEPEGAQGLRRRMRSLRRNGAG